MPFVLIFIAIVLMVSAYRNTIGELGQQLGTDIPGFAKWAAAILAIGLLGMIPGLKKPSWMLLALVVAVIVLANGGGFFQQLQSAFQNLQPVPAGPEPQPSQYQTTPGPPAVSSVNPLANLGITGSQVPSGYGPAINNQNLAPMGLSLLPGEQIGIIGSSNVPGGMGIIPPGAF